ncbi:uncharacterized protein OGAPODRAFT_11717 [Ogataea polymorpha]|uniref:uncharacterized protein n=1 Tax=Ogataea polymorpha TaxID=460523 RepID=UPI0007F37AD2|nr:uncharacterized protein OGAPODRAFT_11717 [Ogataea polymorpha]OBA17356.1 hypothetical protein OGAPODRAFT_11717 [Ogataea polymorpha]
MSFKFPSIYDFPPFFTKQVHGQTLETQKSQWIQLILDYCRYNKIWILSLNGESGDSKLDHVDSEDEDDDDDYAEVTKQSLFTNNKIDRSLKSDFIMEIYNEMISKEKAEWVNPKNHKHGIIVYWHTLEEWANIIFEWIDLTGQSNTVLTLYELRKGDLAKTQEFYGMNPTVLIKVLNVLVKTDRAQILKDDNGKIAGVKFSDK